MNSTAYAPRPSRSNWGRVIYNVLQDSEALLTQDQIWQLVPPSMHVPHSWSKFKTALGNMHTKGYLITSGDRGDKKYAIASAEHYRVRKQELKAYQRRYVQSKKKAKKKAKKKLTQPAPKVRVENALVTGIDDRIAEIEAEQDALDAKREALLAARKLLVGL